MGLAVDCVAIELDITPWFGVMATCAMGATSASHVISAELKVSFLCILSAGLELGDHLSNHVGLRGATAIPHFETYTVLHLYLEVCHGLSLLGFSALGNHNLLGSSTSTLHLLYSI